MDVVSQIHPEAFLAAGYAGFLIAVATGLEMAARLSHRRARGFATAGFHYHEDLDVFECPSGETLHRQEVDHERHLVRYRARADVCNRCRLKSLCTDSDRGREVVRSVAPWLGSEIGRFHRGLSLALMLLAGLVAGVGLARHLHAGIEVWLLGTVLAVVAGCGVRLVRDLVGASREGPATPAGPRAIAPAVPGGRPRSAPSRPAGSRASR